MESIYDKYGGERFWETLVDQFYDKNLNDPMLKNYFEGKDINRVKLMNRGLLAAALRTSEDHFSISVKRVHKNFGIGGNTFDRFVGNLRIVLDQNRVTADDIEEILIVVNSFKEDVTGE